jgi:chloramphenicol 3-O phosphotransferase
VSTHGRIIILNGAPRSGKTSISRAIQELDDRIWLNIGVDGHIGTLPDRLRPGIGLRPGKERPDLEDLIPTLYAGLFESIVAHARLGFNVVADLGIHDRYSRPLGIWRVYSMCFEGFDRLLVGVRCSVKEIARRRDASGAIYAGTLPDGTIDPIVAVWEDAIHDGVVYDLELRTDTLSPSACAAQIIEALDQNK